MEQWAVRAPMNFLHKFYLVEAELAQVTQQDSNAMQKYREAIRLAQKYQYLQEEALANELSARYYLYKKEKKYARLLMKEAHYLYTLWGAKAKADQLEKKHLQLFDLPNVSMPAFSLQKPDYLVTTPKKTSYSNSQQLDLITIVKTSQILSGEVKLENILIRLLNFVRESAGAEKVGLILSNQSDSEPWTLIEEGESDVIRMTPLRSLEETENFPSGIIQYVFRRKEIFVSGDVSLDPKFSQDTYVKARKPKSALCLPITNQGMLRGVLYLENNMLVNVFVKENVQVLKILSTQAAISIENAFLYYNLEQLVEERTKELKATQAELLEKAHKSGQADMATDVLHNIGNILNSITTAEQTITEILTDSVMTKLAKANDLLKSKIETIEDFISNNPRGKTLLEYYLLLGDELENENTLLLSETERLRDKLAVVQNVINGLDSYATEGDYAIEQDPDQLLDEILMLYYSTNDDVQKILKKDYAPTDKVMVYKTKFTFIIVNLIQNALDAMVDTDPAKREILIEIYQEKSCSFVTVADTGCGIESNVLDKVFGQGFSTKKNGHGFELHSCANYMFEMGGRISAHSEGLEKGAKFKLSLPSQKKDK